MKTSLPHLRLRLVLPALLGLSMTSCGPERQEAPAQTAAARPSPAAPGPDADAVPAPAPPSGPLSISTESAVLMALENNPAFAVDRLRPAVTRTGERTERAAFDPVLGAAVSTSHTRDESNLRTRDTYSSSGDVSVRQTLPTGTTVEAGGGHAIGSTENGTDSDTKDTSWDVSITQSLLRGRGLAVNLASLRRARIDTRISEHELRGAAESLVAQVEGAYWDYVLAGRSIAIYEKSLEVAEQSLEEIRERVRVGKVAETELSAAEAELASRRVGLIDARGTMAKRRLALLRLLSPASGEAAWEREVVAGETPEMSSVKLDETAAHVQLALHERPDLAQARLQLERGELDLVRTRNGLLPKLDLFVRLGGSRYADSFEAADDTDGHDASYAVGLNFELPLGNRAPRASYERSQLTLEQARSALRNMEQLVQVDVRSAYVDVASAAERVKATAATRALREKTLDTEQEKFRVGKSTTLLVAQAARDALASQIAEVDAIVAYRKALIALYRLDGSLLARRGIAVPR